MYTELNIAQFCKLTHIFIATGAHCGLARVGDEIRSKPVVIEAQYAESIRHTDEIQNARNAVKNAKAQAKIAGNILLMQAEKAARTTVAA